MGPQADLAHPPKSGWSWFAFLLPPVFCLWHGLWREFLRVSIGYPLASAFIGGLIGFAAGSDSISSITAGVAYFALIFRWARGPANEARYIKWRKRQIALGNMKE